jgi:transposase
MEAGIHSIWISEQLQELGHEVIVANVRELRAISHSDRKSDQVDAEMLARFARVDPKILRPIAHRTVAQQEALTLIRARNLIVRLRTAAVNAVRGLATPCGYRLPASSTLCFAKRCLAVLPPGLARPLGPVLHQIADMTVKIKQYDSAIQQLTEKEYPETQALLKVYGVGKLTALTYVLTLGSKERFQRSRDVGCYLGLRPKRSQSGERDPQLGITKAGNVYLRSLLVSGLLMETGVSYNKLRLHRMGYFEQLLSTNDEISDSIRPLLKLCREHIDRSIRLDTALLRSLERDPLLADTLRRLRTIPGVGPITALPWALEVGDTSRFRSIKQAISYCGLCSAEKSSAEKVMRTPISKQRNKHIQQVLVEAARLAPRYSEELALIYEKERQRGNGNRATLAVARKMVAFMLAVERRNTDFVPASKLRSIQAA